MKILTLQIFMLSLYYTDRLGRIERAECDYGAQGLMQVSPEAGLKADAVVRGADGGDAVVGHPAGEEGIAAGFCGRFHHGDRLYKSTRPIYNSQ